jgi:Spy/CpxP family protein refolding chaperone
MPRLLFQVGLALSLLLNAFFVAGFVFRNWIAPLPFEHRGPPPPPPPGARPSFLDIVASDVSLDGPQREALRGVFEQHAQGRRDRFREIQKTREQIINEYRRSPIDPDKLLPLIDKLSDLRTDQQRDTVRALAQLEERLTPDQRQRLHQVLVDRLSAPPPMQRQPGQPGAPPPPPPRPPSQ